MLADELADAESERHSDALFQRLGIAGVLVIAERHDLDDADSVSGGVIPKPDLFCVDVGVPVALVLAISVGQCVRVAVAFVLADCHPIVNVLTNGDSAFDRHLNAVWHRIAVPDGLAERLSDAACDVHDDPKWLDLGECHWNALGHP